MLRRLALFLGPLALPASHLCFDAAPAERSALGLVIWMALWWVSECAPIWITALLPLLLVPPLTLVHAEHWPAPLRVLRAYADTYIFLFLGGLILAQALQHCGLHRRFALAILARVGTSPLRLLVGLLLATSLVSAWISNTATAAMMLPIALSLVLEIERQLGRRAPEHTSAAMLLAVAFGANIGGLATKIGTAPNAQLASYLEQRGMDASFLEFAAVGGGLVALLLPAALCLLWWHARRDARAVTLDPGTIEAERARLGPLRGPERATLLIFALTAAAWVMAVPIRDLLQQWMPERGWTSAGTESAIAMLGAAAVLLGRVGGGALLPWRELGSISYGTLILLGGGLALALLVSSSGLSDRIGAALEALRGLEPLAQGCLAALVSVSFSAIASNTAVTGLLLPIVEAAAPGSNLRTLLFTTAFASSCDFALPVGTPPNALVFGTGRVRVPVMLRIGLPLNLVAALVTALWCWLSVPWIFG
jgi:sodium-dependent dicarboxylate transporter 2/3/5